MSSAAGPHRLPHLPSADVLLADGTVAVIRPVGPDDAEGLRQLHDQISAENLRLRFFSPFRGAAHSYVEHVLRERPPALVLVVDGHVAAFAAAEIVEPDTAEISFLVEDERHGQGIGSLLLEHLAAVARARGIATFVAEVLLENHPMLEVLIDAGFTLTRTIDADVVRVRMDTMTTATSQAAADARDRRAEARSLHPLLYPESLAVAGVRSNGGGIGRAVLDNIRAGGFAGPLHVVHPRAHDIDGVPAAPSFTEIPVTIDLAVIAVPAEQVLAAVSDAADAQVRAAVVISSGFQELGAAGAQLQQDLAALARARSIRIVGPNCLGVMDNRPQSPLNATFTDALPPSGSLGVATQSGGVGIVLAEQARELGLGIRSLVSLGNKADVSGNDLLAAWTDDPEVTAGALYLESFGNARKFARLARRFAERKPLLAVVGGRSDGGRRAGASHTAAAATPAVGVAALFTQAGVIGCDGAEDLAEAALLLTREPLAKGSRLGIISNAGGMGVLAADAGTAAGLSVPELSAPTRTMIAEHVLGTTGTSNPVDAGAAVASDDLAAIFEIVLTSGEVDAVLVELVATSLSESGSALEALAAVRARHPHLPVVLVPQGMKVPSAFEVTCFRSSASAVRALGRAARYAAWLTERTADLTALAELPSGVRETASVEVLLRHRSEAAEVLERNTSRDGWVGSSDAAPLLSAYRLQPAGGVAVGVEQVMALAESIGFPVAIKVADGDVVHRTERGLVRVGLDSPEAVRRAVQSFESELRREAVPVLVQPIATGVELAVGMVRDRSVGPLVMVGAGGVNTDILSDRVYLLPPVRDSDVRRALRTLRCWPLLEGFRGGPPADVTGLVDVVVSCGLLADEVPLVAEVDLNPVMVSSRGATLVDVKLRLAQAPAVAGDEPRQLRQSR